MSTALTMKAITEGGAALQADGQTQRLVAHGQEPYPIQLEEYAGLRGNDKRAYKQRAIEKSEPIFHWNAVLGSLIAASGLVIMICTLSLGKTIETTTYTSLPNEGTTLRKWDVLLSYSIGLMLLGLCFLLARVYVFWKDITLAIHYAYVNGFRWIMAFVRDCYMVLILGVLSGIHDWMYFIQLLGLQTLQIGFLHSNERDNSSFHHAARNNDRYKSNAGYRKAAKHADEEENPEIIREVPASHYYNLFYAYVAMGLKWTVLGIYWGETLVKVPKDGTYFCVLLFVGLICITSEIITMLMFTLRYLRSHEFLPAVLRKKRRFEIVYNVVVSTRDLGLLWATFSLALLAPMVV